MHHKSHKRGLCVKHWKVHCSDEGGKKGNTINVNVGGTNINDELMIQETFDEDDTKQSGTNKRKANSFVSASKEGGTNKNKKPSKSNFYMQRHIFWN